MRDRFPLILAGFLLLFGSLGWFLVQGARRAETADVLSTFRASPRGARAVFLLAQELGLDVQRYKHDLEQLPERGAFVLLAVEAKGRSTLFDEDDEEAQDEGEEGEERYEGFNYFAPRLSEDEQEALLAHVKQGHTLIYVPWGVREDPILTAAGFSLREAPRDLGLRTLVAAQPAPYTLGAERIETQVQGWLDYSEHAVPLLVDEHLRETVAAVAPYGLGRILVISAPELAMNRALPRADNARLWTSLLWTASRGGPVYFDEFHHGFSEDRSIVQFALRYQLHFAVGQLLLGLVCWALALRRFGSPRPPPRDERQAGMDALLASSRLYREGHHHGYAAHLIAQGLAQELAPAAGLSGTSPLSNIARNLAERGRPELAASLNEVDALARHARSERAVEKVATAAAHARTRYRSQRAAAPAARS